MIHKEESDLAGKTIKVIDGFNHQQYPDLDEIVVEDWWDRVYGKSWMVAAGNPAAMVYAMRTGTADHSVPLNDEVLYGKYKGMGVLFHKDEIKEVMDNSNNKDK